MITRLKYLLFSLMLSYSFLTFSQSDEMFVIGVTYSPPSYKHGESAMYDTINKYLKSFNIPDTLSKNVRVYTSFLVDSIGNVSDIVLTRGHSKYLDSLAIELTKIITREKWNPGGYFKPTKMTIPFTFKSSQTD